MNNKLLFISAILAIKFSYAAVLSIDTKGDKDGQISNIVVFYGDIIDGVLKEIERPVKSGEKVINTVELLDPGPKTTYL